MRLVTPSIIRRPGEAPLHNKLDHLPCLRVSFYLWRKRNQAFGVCRVGFRASFGGIAAGVMLPTHEILLFWSTNAPGPRDALLIWVKGV